MQHLEKDTCLVSVIIPCYNTEKYIEKCLESVVKQTYSNLEIVVIDDGSPDNLYKVVEKYCDYDKRVKFIRQKNKGLSGARNTGLRNISGDYVVFLDSDDSLADNAIELLLDKAISNNADIVMPDRYVKLYANGKRIEDLLFVNYENYNSVTDFVINVIMGQGRAWRATSVLYRVSIIKQNLIEFPEGYIAEDIVFNLRFLSKANIISFLKFVTLHVNKRDDSITATYRSNLAETDLFIDQVAEEFILNSNCNDISAVIARNSLLSRNIILFLTSEISPKNNKTFRSKIERICSVLEIPRVNEAFRSTRFVHPYWGSKIKIYYIALMRLLIRLRLKWLAILLAMLRNIIYH